MVKFHYIYQVSIGKEFAILFGVLFLPGLVAQFGVVPGNQFESVLYNVQILAVAIPQVLLVAWFPELNTPGMRRRMGVRRPVIADILPALLTAAALVIASSAAALLVTAFETPEGGEQLWRFSQPELIPLILLSTVAIGYREELFYRAYLFTRAGELQTDPAVTVAATSLLFGIGHLYQGIEGFVITTVLGVVLGLIFLRTGNLHAVAVGHGLYNFTVLVLSGTSLGSP